MYWSSSSGKIELKITKAEALRGSHQGQCDHDILELRNKPRIKRQLDKLVAAIVAEELSCYGAWDDELELCDHEENLQRLLWIACGDINDGNI